MVDRNVRRRIETAAMDKVVLWSQFARGVYDHPLEAAVVHGRIEDVTAVLEHGRDCVLSLGENDPRLCGFGRRLSEECNPGCSFFNVAAQRNDVKLARYLISQGVSNYRHYRRETALTIAVAEHKAEMVRLLLDADADVNFQFVRDGKIVSYSALHIAAKNGSTTILGILLDRGADLNARDGFGQTALFHANNTEIARILLDRGADVNARNNFDETALFRNENTEIIRILLDRGADVNARASNGSTALYWAIKLKNNTQVMRFLLNRGAEVNARTCAGYTALFGTHFIRNENIAEVVRILLEHGAEVNVRNILGESLLSGKQGQLILSVLQELRAV